MTNSTPFGKTIAAAALAALTLGSAVTMSAGSAEARDGRKGALIAAGVLGALAVGAIAAQANDGYYAGTDVGNGYAPGYAHPAYEPVQYYRSYDPHPGYGYRHHRRHHGYSETGYAYRGPVCKLKKQQVWDGYGWRVQRVQVCR